MSALLFFSPLMSCSHRNASRVEISQKKISSIKTSDTSAPEHTKLLHTNSATKIRAKLSDAKLSIGSTQQLTSIGLNADARFMGNNKRLLFISLRPPLKHNSIVLVDVDGYDEALFNGPVEEIQTAAFWQNQLVFLSPASAASGQLLHLVKGRSEVMTCPALATVHDLQDLATAAKSGELFLSARTMKMPAGMRAIFALQADCKNLKQVSNGHNMDREPSPSPDGKNVVFRRQMSPAQAEIFLIQRDNNSIQALTNFGEKSWSPTIHPSGRIVVFANNHFGERDFDLFALRIGEDSAQRLTTTAGFDGLPVFSPDGKTLCWTSSRQGGLPQIFVAPWIEQSTSISPDLPSP